MAEKTTLDCKEVVVHTIIKTEWHDQRDRCILLVKEAICRDYSVVGDFQITETECLEPHPDTAGLGEGKHYHMELKAMTDGPSWERR